MLEILFIILFVICLGATAAALMLAFQMTRDYKADFLNHYFYYLMAYFVFGLYGLWGQAIVRYLLEKLDSKSTVVEAMATLFPLFGVPFLLVSWLMLIKMAFTLANKSISALQTLIYFVSIMALFAAIGWLLGGKTDLAQLESYLYGGTELLLFLAFLLVGWGAIKKIKNVQKQNSYRNFCWLLLLGLILRLAILPFISWNIWLLAAILLLYFVGNLLPVFYLRLQADQLFTSYTAELNDQNSFEHLIVKHGISKRETEIVKLICQGKTNQQIADALFISLQTVKDHNHRIYTKIGIRSRMQLINLVK